MRKQEARHVKGVLDGLLKKWEEGAVKKGTAVRQAWMAAAGDEARKHAHAVSLKNGALMVIVENSVWLYKLTLDKKDILERFNETYSGRKKARDIRFRVGSVDS